MRLLRRRCWSFWGSMGVNVRGDNPLLVFWKLISLIYVLDFIFSFRIHVYADVF